MATIASLIVLLQTALTLLITSASPNIPQSIKDQTLIFSQQAISLANQTIIKLFNQPPSATMATSTLLNSTSVASSTILTEEIIIKEFPPIGNDGKPVNGPALNIEERAADDFKAKWDDIYNSILFSASSTKEISVEFEKKKEELCKIYENNPADFIKVFCAK